MAFSYKAAITIDHTKVQSTDQTDFPILVSGTYAGASGVPDLRVAGSGGHVQHSSGYDIQFFSDSGLTTRIPAEREKYVSTTGEIVYWVKQTVLTATDVVIYIAYGDAGISADPNSDATYGKTNVWDSNYKGVYHLADGSTLNKNDSTGNANNLVNGFVNSPTAATGQIDGGAAFATASSQALRTPTNVFSSANLTLQTWADFSTVNSYQGILSAWTSNADSVEIFVNNVNSNLVGGNFSNAAISATNSVTVAGGWYHIAMVSSGGVTTLYINGVASGTTGTTHYTTFSTYTGIGMRANQALFFNGSLDEVRLSSIGRSADWIKTEFNNQSSPSTFYAMGSETSNGGSSFSLSLGFGSFADNGQSSNFLKGLKLALSNGSLTLSGQAVLLKKGYTLALGQGSYTETGQAANFLRALRTALAQGTYTFTGQSVTLTLTPAGGIAYSLTLAQGSFALTGKDAAFLKALKAAMAQGTFTLTGQAAAFKKGFTLTAIRGNYALSGQAAAFLKALHASLANGSYTFDGKAVTLTYSPVGGVSFDDNEPLALDSMGGKVLFLDTGLLPYWSTAGRPASPAIGQAGFNTQTSALEVYTGSAWKSVTLS